jgi:hypothetical protein
MMFFIESEGKYIIADQDVIPLKVSKQPIADSLIYNFSVLRNMYIQVIQ